MRQPAGDRGPWRRQLPLLLLVGGHLFLGSAYGLYLPLFESPDEPGHFLFVRYLTAYGRLPVQTANFDGPRAHHPPAYYLLGALLTRWVAIEGSPDAIHMRANPKFGFRASDSIDDNKTVYVHHGPEERFPFQGQALAVHLIRLLSLSFSALAVAFTYGAAQQLRPGQAAFAFSAAGLVAFNPMVLYMSGLVNNDTAALATGAGLIYLLTRFMRSGFTPRRWALVGAAWGLGLMLKASALVLIAPIGLALVLVAWQSREWCRLLTNGLALAAAATLIAGWWFVRNAVLYGDPLGNAAVQLVSGSLTAADRLVDLPGQLTWFFEGIVGCAPIGPLSLCFPGWMYGLAALVGLACVVGGLRLNATRAPVRSLERLRHGPATSTVIWAAHGLLIAATLAGAVSYGLSLRNGWQGRYLFPAYASGALCLAAGLLAWLPARWRAAGAGLFVLASLALSAFGLWGLVLPRYGIPRSPSSREIAETTPLDARVGDVARVLAYHLAADSAHPGGMLAVTVYWQVLARTAQPYTVFIHIYSAETGSIAQRDTYPGLGNYATIAWDPGRTFVDTYRLYLPPDAPSARHATILLGLYDEASGERLPVTGKNAGPSEDSWVQFGSIIVEP
jgi:4-amino-4-deoxy-L-arabinose transferase-like glycosyltransferase